MKTDDHTSRLPAAPSVAERIKAGELDPPADYNTYPAPSVPMGVARRIIADLFTQDTTATIVSWRGDFWTFNNGTWAQVNDPMEIEAKLWHRLEEVTYSTQDGDVKAWAPNPNRVNAVMRTLQVLAHLPDENEAPTWLPDPARNLDRLVVVNNGIFNLDTRHLDAHTPNLFTTWSLSFDYNDKATCPQWEKFLGTIFAHDPAGQLLLQEWMGYLISGRTDMHKALLMVGPPRAGKGTISRVMRGLLGPSNVATTTFATLGSEFGQESLIGKPLAVLEDARDAGRRMTSATERILNIVGEDDIAINRKNRPYWIGRLPTRFMLSSNEVPQLVDNSSAAANRFVSLRLAKSFLGKEDHTLEGKLFGELSGIFNWALEGLDRLDAQDGFTPAATGADIGAMLLTASSPLHAWLEDCEAVEAVDDPEVREDFSSVHQLYRHWASEAGEKALSQREFIRAVEAMEGLSVKMRDIEERTSTGARKRKRFIYGLKRVEGTWLA